MNADGVERNQEATLFVGELDAQVTESLLWELFLQAGPVGKQIEQEKKTVFVHSLLMPHVCCSERSHSTRQSKPNHKSFLFFYCDLFSQ